jgi:deoxycytidylate deaminase
MNKNNSDLRDCKMYLVMFPCNKCAQIIIQSGIKEVIYVSDQHADNSKCIAARKMLHIAQVSCALKCFISFNVSAYLLQVKIRQLDFDAIAK